MPASLPPVAFEEAVAWLRARVPVTDDQFRALDARARRKAFAVAGVAQLDLVNDVLTELDAAVRDGATLADFKAAVGARLRAAWGGAVARPGHRLETIYRTNVQLAYGAGRWAQLTDPDQLAARPAWVFDAVLDSRTSAPCRARDGVTLPASDAWWRTNFPPMHHRCRSGVRSLPPEGAAARGFTVNPPSGGAADGFGLTPDAAEWAPDPGDYPGALWRIFVKKVPDAEREAAILPPEQLPKDRRVPRDRVLRGASPPEVVGSVRRWLTERHPLPGPLRFVTAADEAAVAKVEAEWVRRAKRFGGDPEDGLIDRTSRATRFFDQVILMPEVVAELAGTVYERARAAKTIAHEWCHALRRSPDRFAPFEEGAAELFAHAVLAEMLGARRLRFPAYPDLEEAVALLSEHVDVAGSREVARGQRAWLRAALERAGFADAAVRDVLSYNGDDEAWLVRVRRLVGSER